MNVDGWVWIDVDDCVDGWMNDVDGYGRMLQGHQGLRIKQ